MSSRAGSIKKQNRVFSETSDTLFDPFLGYKPRKSLAEIPWPEWNDADLNAEVWGEAKLRQQTSKLKQKEQTKESKQSETGIAEDDSRLFEDPSPPLLPSEIKENVGSWKRPQQVFPNAALTVYDPKNLLFQLKVPSSKGKCNFLNRFNNILPILQYFGEKYAIPVEMESATFAVNNPLESWRPWHHIYALNKAGKGAVHKPLLNPYGKYVLRLFYFGCWRKFVVDDQIPCDKFGKCLLPVTQVEGELWPILLAKGMLKIISLTPSCEMSVIDFPLVSCLTAWIDVKFTALNKTYDQLWRRIILLTPHFKLPEEHLEENSKQISTAVDSTKGKTSKKQSEKMPKANAENVNFCSLFATLGGFPPNLADLNGESLLLTMNRDIPLVKAEKKEPTKPWKRHRWIEWALEKKIWIDELLLPPYRCLYCITFKEDLHPLFAPDPFQEAAMYVIPKKEILNEKSNEKLTEEENKSFQFEVWFDYNKFYNYMVLMNVLFRPTYFISNFRITSTAAPAIPTKAKGSAPQGSKFFPQNIYVYSPFLMPTFNQPPFLLCQAPIEIFICISLWVYPQKDIMSVGYLDPQQPELLKVGQASLVLEEHDWRDVGQGKILGVIKTVGHSSIYLNLEPGRHILKLWLDTDCPYVLNIFSNFEILVQKPSKIRFHMTNESERISNYILEISDAFTTLTQNFGKEPYREALHKFYMALKTGTKYVDHLFFDFVQSFLDCIMSALKNLINNQEELKTALGALRSLFINLRIKLDFPQKHPSSVFSIGTKKTLKKNEKYEISFKERTSSSSLTSDQIEKIVKIQSVFRGYRTRLLFKCQTPSRKEFKPYSEKLKKISDLIFSPSKRETEVGKILREVVKTNPNLLSTFKMSDDFSQILHVDEYTGKVPNVEAYAWVPLVRFTIALHFDEPEPCAFYLSCNLEQHFLVGVNNDTNEEIFLLTNTLSPHYYNRNVKGYTIFGYGWNGASVKTIHWRLEMVTMKWFQGIHLCDTLLGPECHSYLLPTLEMLEVKNFYIPNQISKISRCFIAVRRKCILTLRFSISYRKARFHLSIFQQKKNKKPTHMEIVSFNLKNQAKESFVNAIVTENVSEDGAVFIPSLILDVSENEVFGEAGEGTTENLTKYILEAYVIDDSWPLSKHEWGVIEPIRTGIESINHNFSTTGLKKGGTESMRKFSRTFKRLSEKNIENPFWHLQIVSDMGQENTGSNVVVGEERWFTDSIKAIKKSWEENDPGRTNRGKEMRLKFLKSILLESGVKNRSDSEEDWGEDGGEDYFLENEIRKISSFSYLLKSRSPTRYSKSPKVLPKMPTNELLQRYSVREKSDFQMGDNISISTERKRKTEIAIMEEERAFLDDLARRRQTVMNEFTDSQQLSEELMEQAYEERLKAINKMVR